MSATAPTATDEMLVAVNPDPDSRLPYLLLVPFGPGLVFRTSGTWPREKALFCYRLERADWPEQPEIVERAPVRSCVRRGGAIDLVLDRGRENRSQLVFTKARGRDVVFWQSPRTRKQARPNVSTPTARAAGIAALPVTIDTRERYAYKFASQQVELTGRALPAGDYGTVLDGRLVGVVERKSLPDLVSSLINGTLRFALGELSTVPRAAVVVEDRYSQVFKLTRVRPAVVADGLAELQVRWPQIPIVFAENRQLAEEWTYRFLAAAHTWATSEAAMPERLGLPLTPSDTPGGDPGAPSTAEVRAWAILAGLPVSDRGRLRPEVWQAWQQAHDGGPSVSSDPPGPGPAQPDSTAAR